MRKLLWLLIAMLFACAGEAPEELLGTSEQAWYIRPGVNSTGRTWGVLTGSNTACTNSGAQPGKNCYWFSTTTAGSGQNNIKYALVDNFPADSWASDEAARFVEDATAWNTEMQTAALGSNMAINLTNVPAAQADVLIKPYVGTSTTSLSIGNYTYVNFTTATNCFGTCEDATCTSNVYTNSYQRCNKATVFFAPTEFLSLAANNGWGTSQRNAARRWMVNHALHALIGIGTQNSSSGAVTSGVLTVGVTPFFLTNEEKCRLTTLQGAMGSLYPGVGYFGLNTGSPCPN